MSADYGSYYNLAKRIDDSFMDIDGDTCIDLRKSDGKYLEMWEEVIKLQNDFPIIPQIVEGKGAVNISTEEHGALSRYLSLKNDMENMERKQIYYRGHTDNCAYLVEIVGIHID